MAKVLIIAALTLLLAVHSNASVHVRQPRARAVRSAEWDEYMRSLHRERRNTNNQNPQWQDRGAFPTCTLTDLTTYDALQRRESGLLAPAQDQGNCGGCWAFASVNAYTDKISIRDGTQAELWSAEYNTRCYRGSINRNGCCGASDMVDAVMFLEEAGTVTQTCLPYTLNNYPPGAISRVQSLFNSDFFTRSYKRLFPLECPTACSGAGMFNPLDNRVQRIRIAVDDATVIQLLDQGETFVVTMHVTPAFQCYRCGVYSGPQINGGTVRVNHAVEIVDYSNSSFMGTPYWVVKNSWGTGFGEGGYFRIARNLSQLTDFLYLVLQQPIEDTPPDDFSSAQNSSVGAAESVTDPQNDPLVKNATSTSVSEMNSGNLIICKDSSKTAVVTLTNIINATQQVIAGYSLDIAISARVQGCSENESSIIILTVDLNLDGSFVLTNYSYDALSDVGTGSAAITITGHTVAFLMLAVLTMVLLLIG